MKDRHSNGILSGLELPKEDEFDVTMNRIFTKKRTVAIKARQDIYKWIRTNTIFDYLDTEDNLYYPMTFRIVRFQLPNGNYETLMSNLEEDMFSLETLKELYFMRWGIETSFRELKFAIGLNSFHSKKVECITQEVFAKMIMYNFCEMITLHVIINKKSTKHHYQVNYTAAILICKQFFRILRRMHPPDVEALIQKYVLPVRKDRSPKRKVKARAVVSFLYRIT